MPSPAVLTWITIISQCAGVGITIWAVTVALKAPSKAQKRLARGQASMVFARSTYSTVSVVNHGDRPVRDVFIHVEFPPESKFCWAAPAGRRIKVADLLLAGGGEDSTRSYYSVKDNANMVLLALKEAPPPGGTMVLRFVDIDNQGWERRGDELPQPVSEETRSAMNPT